MLAHVTSTTRAPETGLPLVSLLRRAEDAFIAEFDHRVAASEFCALSLAHSRNVLRHLGDGPLRASQVVERCGISKQAVSQQIAHLERNGYLTVAVDPTDQRARILTLTEKGVRAQCLVRRLFADIERDWAERIGADDAAALRRALGAVLSEEPADHRC
jgi:DNA-binding MarR family transcriptional regulator